MLRHTSMILGSTPCGASEGDSRTRRARVAAIQLQSALGDVSYNLSECERLAVQAGNAGARWIVLPEFFTTGLGFSPALAGKALPPDGDGTALLTSIAKRFGAFDAL